MNRNVRRVKHKRDSEQTQFEKAKLNALKSDRLSEIAQACDKLGDFYYSSSLYDQALEEYKECLDIRKCERDLEGLAKLYRKCADINLLMNEYDLALDNAESYLTYAKAAASPTEIQRAFVTYSRIYMHYGSSIKDPGQKTEMLSRAKKYSQDSMDAIPDVPDTDCDAMEKKRMQVGQLQNMYVILSLQQEHKAAEECFDRAAKIAEVFGLHTLQFNLHMAKVLNAMERKDYDSTLAFFPKTFAILELLRGQSTFKDALLEATTAKLNVLLITESFDKARHLLEAALKEVPKNRDVQKIFTNDIERVTQIIRLQRLVKKGCGGKLSRALEMIADSFSQLDSPLPELAVVYYKKAVEECDKKDTMRLSSLYYSIATSLEDMGESSQASEYFSRDVKLCRAAERPLEGVGSALKLAEIACATNKEKAFVLEQYAKARKLAVRGNSVTKEMDVLNSLADYLQAIGDTETADQTRREVDYLNCGENEEEEDQVIQEVEDIDLSQVMSDNDENENETLSRTAKNKRNYRLKKNAKGETDLHTVCKTGGQLDKLEAFIRNGHPVNVVDKQGYAPLHEAAICGCVDYVAALHEAGAKLNVSNNLGLTPFMDACDTLDCDTIEYFLNHGVDVDMRDNNMWNSSDYLESAMAKKGDRLSESEVQKLDQLVIRIKSMEKSSNGAVINKKKFSVLEEDQTETDVQDFLVDDLPERRHRRSRKFVSKSSPKENQSPPPVVLHNDEYVETIDTHRDVIKRPLRQSKLTLATRKTKEETKRKYSKESSSRERKVAKKQRLETFEQFNEVLLQDESPFAHDMEEATAVVPAPPVISRAPTPPVVVATNFGDIMAIRVSVEGQLLLVPIKRQSTVKNLAEEASKRFCEVTKGRKPLLQLSTADGAHLGDGDPLELLYPVGTYDANLTLKSTVVGWQVDDLPKRYHVVCQEMSRVTLENVCKKMTDAHSTGTLDLKDAGLVDPATLETAVKALRYQSSLRELNLTRCLLATSPTVFKELCESLATLDNMDKLNLSNNALASSHLHILTTLAAKCMPQIKDLNLSFNELDDSSVDNLISLLQIMPALKRLSLSSCLITSPFFKRRSTWTPILSKLDTLDVSYNRLGVSGIESLLQCVDPEKLSSLDISGCISFPDKGHFNKCMTDYVSRANDNALVTLTMRRNAVNRSDLPTCIFNM